MPPFATRVTIAWSVRLSVCLYVCRLSHSCTRPVRRNEMPFGRDTRVVPSNIVLDRGPDSPREWGDLGSEPPVRSDAAYR